MKLKHKVELVLHTPIKIYEEFSFKSVIHFYPLLTTSSNRVRNYQRNPSSVKLAGTCVLEMQQQ